MFAMSDLPTPGAPVSNKPFELFLRHLSIDEMFAMVKWVDDSSVGRETSDGSIQMAYLVDMVLS
tara:strand:- start:8455 stop:8646 length:192 start_codon:yes stop_codon:yes gene_type:complete